MCVTSASTRGVGDTSIPQPPGPENPDSSLITSTNNNTNINDPPGRDPQGQTINLK